MLGFFVFCAYALAATPAVVTGIRRILANDDNRDVRKRQLTLSIFIGILGAIAITTVLWWSSVSVEFYWFEQWNWSHIYGKRFWTGMGIAAVFGLFGGALTYLSISWPFWIAPSAGTNSYRDYNCSEYWGEYSDDYSFGYGTVAIGILRWMLILTAICVWAGIGYRSSEEVLAWWNAASFGSADPIFGLDASFHIFTLPVVNTLLDLLWYTTGLGVVVAIAVCAFFSARAKECLDDRHEQEKPMATNFLRRAVKIGCLFLAIFGCVDIIDTFFDRYDLLQSRSGRIHGVSAVDLHAWIPAYWIWMGCVAVLVALTSWVCIRQTKRSYWVGGIAIPVLFLIGSLGVNVLYPHLYQKYVVDPEEYRVERSFAENAIAATREAFGLDHMKEIEIDNLLDELTREDLEAHPEILSNMRLADYRAMRGSFESEQEIQPSYHFNDVDVNRMVIDGELKQVVLSVREIDVDSLPESARGSWNARHLVYTHGMGMVLSFTDDFKEGRPVYRIENIPAQSSLPEIQLANEGLYFAEETDDYVFVGTDGIEEFHYPTGESDVTTKYTGKAGVPIGSPLSFRRFALAYNVDGARMYTSNYLTSETRLLMRRQIRERAETVAPFLAYDDDPYPVVTKEGRIVFIMDAYTTTDRFPYSEPLLHADAQTDERGRYTNEGERRRGEYGPYYPWYLEGVNYVRNSVKVVEDTYDGTLTFYVFDPNDPIIQTWMKVYPDLFKDASEMPAELRAAVRYPEDLLKVQAHVYNTYHMSQVEKFLRKQGVWQVATEKYHGGFGWVEPYSLVTTLPGEDEPEFLQLVQLTPKGKRNLSAWMAGRSDGDHLGQLIVYKLPTQRTIPGARMIENFIDEDEVMSTNFTRWDQKGSSVIRGNLITQPIGLKDGLGFFYYEPIFVKAEGGTSIPKLTRIVVGVGRRVAWGRDRDEALNALFNGSTVSAVSSGDLSSSGVVEFASGDDGEQLEQARALLATYFRLMGEGKAKQAGELLEQLQQTLNAVPQAPVDTQDAANDNATGEEAVDSSDEG